jgi:K+-transporting ATPase ATPase C chain
VRARIGRLRLENGLGVADTGGFAPRPSPLTPIAADLVLSSASGLDPDISVDAALLQIGRVARERSLEPVQVRSLVLRNIEPPFLGMFALARVNVLKLNLALDSMSSEAE